MINIKLTTSLSGHYRFILVAVYALFLCNNIVSAQQNIVLIPTIHQLHNLNPKYNYDSLRALVSDFNPSVIAVEIRNEDMKCDTDYLKRNYPQEMWRMRYWFPNATIIGFDWLGADIEGRLIPENYWKEQSEIKKWEKLLNVDTFWNSKTEECDRFTKQRIVLLQSLSLSQLLKSNDSALTVGYYNCLGEKLIGSVHYRILDFYNLRNKQMAGNLEKIIRRYPGKRLMILTGDDHYPFLIKLLHLN